MKTVTFFNHYGAILTKKRLGGSSAVRPVPRALSSSCGSCVVTGASLEEIIPASGEYLEAVYENEGNGYRKIYEC